MHEVVYFRGAYCAASVARLTNIITPQLFDGTPEWVIRYFYAHCSIGVCCLNHGFNTQKRKYRGSICLHQDVVNKFMSWFRLVAHLHHKMVCLG